MSRPIRLVRVRQNNLKTISVEFPPRKISVVTGLSGSGKSSLVFDTLYAEGQRRYVESLSTYTRQFLAKMPKPDVDSIENIPPAIALEQKNHVVNSRSTVGTQTEIVDYLRLLFAKVGRTYCMDCGGEVSQIGAQTVLKWALEWLPKRKALILAPLQLPSSKDGKKTSAKAQHASIESFLQIIREQGFQRILLKPKKGRPEVLDLEDIASAKISPGQEFFVVVDRIRMESSAEGPEGSPANSPANSKDVRARLLDSIEQALRIGHGTVHFFDMAALEESVSSKNISLQKSFDTRFACKVCGLEHKKPEPHLFSFNSPIGACGRCSGFGFNLDLDESLVVKDPTRTLKNGAIDPLSKPSLSDWQSKFFRFAERHGISIGKRYGELTASEKKLLWEGDPKDNTFPGILAIFEEMKRYKYKLHVRVFIRRYQSQTLCPECKGLRLKREALAVKISSKSIGEVTEMSVGEALAWIRSSELTPSEKKVAQEVFTQVERRLKYLDEVGVGYLTLSRLAKTLSGGEFQRINLATQLGNGLCGTLYVLDEPSIGLHAADTSRLIGVLKQLRDQGNCVVVVEHDLEVMRAADWLVELGPGGGARGGELMAQGTSADLIRTLGSVTGKYLSGDFRVNRDRPPREPATRFLSLTGCKEHNLKNLSLEIPLDRLVVVTGVSGSGKSTLVHKTLYTALARVFQQTNERAGRFDRMYGADQLSGVVLLDQSSIGKSSRSNPMTYLKGWDEVRKIYASQVLSLKRGYTAKHFSFNVDGGRCPVCEGEGEITLDMHFMAEIKLPCEECGGKKFKKAILDVTYRGKNVHQLLHSTVDEAFELFRDHPILARKLRILREVGLGYLQVGQSATTLSGGESQRLKIAATLDDAQMTNLLYIFDEPTTGLHLDDIKKLLNVIQDLVDAKHSVLLIEHHLDVIAQADWVIDLGPGGGPQGGNLIAQGPPQKLRADPKSITGVALKAYQPLP